MAITTKELVEAGAHFGHQKRKWNPKMREYIFTERKGIHIIDLKKSAEMFTRLEELVARAAKEGDILFVGTKKQASELIRQTGIKTKQPYVDNRWLGGTLTNLKTIKKRVARLKELEQLFETGDISVYPKKEQAKMRKTQSAKLKKLELKYMELQIQTLIQVTLITLFQQTMMLLKLSN